MSGHKKTASYRMRFFRVILGVLTLHLLRGVASVQDVGLRVRIDIGWQEISGSDHLSS